LSLFGSTVRKETDFSCKEPSSIGCTSMAMSEWVHKGGPFLSNTILDKETKILVKVHNHISHPSPPPPPPPQHIAISLGFQDLRQLTMKGNRPGNKEREIKSSSYIEGV
jgi:hypothetical protein